MEVAALSDVPIAVLGALGGALATAASFELVGGVKRARRRRIRGRDAFRVRFIEVSGGNKCDTLDEQTESLGDLQAFRVWLLFELWSDRKATVTHMDLKYDWPQSGPTDLAVSVGTDERSLPVDVHERLVQSLVLEEGDALRVRVHRRFVSPQFMTGSRDTYRRFQLACWLASAEGGLELLTISGRFEPGGRVDDVEVRLEPDDQHARNRQPRRARPSHADARAEVAAD